MIYAEWKRWETLGNLPLNEAGFSTKAVSWEGVAVAAAVDLGYCASVVIVCDIYIMTCLRVIVSGLVPVAMLTLRLLL